GGFLRLKGELTGVVPADVLLSSVIAVYAPVRLAPGDYDVIVMNPDGQVSDSKRLSVLAGSSQPLTPFIANIVTSPNPPVNGQAFTITLNGSNFSASNSTVLFSGPGCSSPCSINASGSTTQVSGQAILATG